MVEATGIVTNGVWTANVETVLEQEIVYITQLEVEVSLESMDISVEIDA